MWIDRVAIVWAVIVWVFVIWLSGMTSDVAFAPEVAVAVLKLAGAPWLLLRGLYFVVTGRIVAHPRAPAYRPMGISLRPKAAPRMEVLPPEAPPGGR